MNKKQAHMYENNDKGENKYIYNDYFLMKGIT